MRVGDRRRERVHTRTNGARAAREKGERMGGRRTRVSDGHVFVGVQLRERYVFVQVLSETGLKRHVFARTRRRRDERCSMCTRATSNNRFESTV